MLNQQTLEKLKQLKLKGMLHALEQWRHTHQTTPLKTDDVIGLLCDSELTYRHNNRLQRLVKSAKLRYPNALIEDINFDHKRAINQTQWHQLTSTHWLAEHQNILLTGATGVGKTYLACAFGQLACRNNYRTAYFRLSKLLQTMRMAKADGSYTRVLATLLKIDCLIIDDWGIDTIEPNLRADLLELIDDRYDQRSIIIAAQLPVEHWHEYIGDNTIADAMLDRIVHQSITLNLKGESLRKKQQIDSPL